MSRPYIIFTDSTSDLPKSIIDMYEVGTVALPYTINKNDYYYNLKQETNFKSFYDEIRHGHTAKTNILSMEQYVKELEVYMQKGLDILFITICSNLSKIYSVLCKTKTALKEKYPNNNLVIVDSRRIGATEGLIVAKALQIQANGKSLSEVYQWIERYKLGYRGLFMIDDVFNVIMDDKRGEGITESEAHLGSIIQLKPIVHVNFAGRIEVYGKPLGRKNAIDFFCKVVSEKAYDPINNTAIICHGDSIHDAKSLKKCLEKKIQFKDVLVQNIGPIAGARLGADTLGIAYMGET